MALAGLYPPSDEEKWNEEVLWQPIPVHTIPGRMDYILPTLANSPTLAAARKRYLAGPEVQKIYTDNADLFAHWSHMCGGNIRTIDCVNGLHDTLRIEKDRNMP